MEKIKIAKCRIKKSINTQRQLRKKQYFFIIPDDVEITPNSWAFASCNAQFRRNRVWKKGRKWNGYKPLEAFCTVYIDEITEITEEEAKALKLSQIIVCPIPFDDFIERCNKSYAIQKKLGKNLYRKKLDDKNFKVVKGKYIDGIRNQRHDKDRQERKLIMNTIPDVERGDILCVTSWVEYEERFPNRDDIYYRASEVCSVFKVEEVLTITGEELRKTHDFHVSIFKLDLKHFTKMRAKRDKYIEKLCPELKPIEKEEIMKMIGAKMK
ncbi:hypothetical protein B7939_01950 [Eggerthia catenaformis]|nr:hypothetical protein B7939_01950 [Eggerthia catenaformis]